MPVEGLDTSKEFAIVPAVNQYLMDACHTEQYSFAVFEQSNSERLQ